MFELTSCKPTYGANSSWKRRHSKVAREGDRWIQPESDESQTVEANSSSVEQGVDTGRYQISYGTIALETHQDKVIETMSFFAN
jgi:hypothetical protein